MIHPTAIIDPSAEIHESVEIGPFVVIGKNVKIGEGTKIESSVRIHDNVEIGKNNFIDHSAAIGGMPQSVGFDPKLVSGVKIGDNNLIREFVTIHRASKENENTIIKNNAFLMENAHVAHDAIIGNYAIIVHAVAIAGHVVVDDHAFISGLVAIHQFCRVGTFSMVAGCSKVVKDVPPYSTVDGNPASVIGLNPVGMKRKGIPLEIRNEIKEAYKLIYHSHLNTKQALQKIEEELNLNHPEIATIYKFFKESERGVTDHR